MQTSELCCWTEIKQNKCTQGGACIVAVNYCNCDIPWQVAVNLPATPVAFKCKTPGAFVIERNGQELTHGKDVK